MHFSYNIPTAATSLSNEITNMIQISIIEIEDVVVDFSQQILYNISQKCYSNMHIKFVVIKQALAKMVNI